MYKDEKFISVHSFGPWSDGLIAFRVVLKGSSGATQLELQLGSSPLRTPVSEAPVSDLDYCTCEYH